MLPARILRFSKRFVPISLRCLSSDKDKPVVPTPPPINHRKVLEDMSIGQYHLEALDDTFQRTSATVLQQDLPESTVCIDSVSDRGFRLTNNAFLFGPVALFPRTALSWRVPSVNDITEESVEFLTLLEPKLDLVIIGAGDDEHVAKVRQRIAPLFLRCHIGLEVLPSERAASLFNYMNAEGRYVAALLYPPQKLFISESDSIVARMRWMDLTESQSGDLLFGTEGSNPVQSVKLLIDKLQREAKMFPLMSDGPKPTEETSEAKENFTERTVKQLKDPVKP